MSFLIFRGAMLPMISADGLPTALLYGLLALTLLRMLPVVLALLNTRLSPVTTIFLGWFGPRGLASVLFLLLILEETEIPGKDLIFTVVVCTVALSVVLHGLTAGPGSRWYGVKIGRFGECPETRPVPSEPLPGGGACPGRALGFT